MSPEPTVSERRAASLRRAAEAGFSPAESQRESNKEKSLRPAVEIAKRLAGLVTLFFWVVAPEAQLPDAAVAERVDRDGLREQLTEHERSILALPRARATKDLGSSVGWHLEQMWSLAWALGFEREPPISGEMIGDEEVEGIFDFVSGKLGVDALLERARPRSLAEVAALDDLFSCVESAVRRAELGEQPSVPKGFDAKSQGGVIRERRHGLSWCLSPGVGWDDVDLST